MTTPNGKASVFVIGTNNKVAQRSVTADRTQGADWVVTDGLRAGDRVVTQGGARLRPNAEVKPVPASTPQRATPPKKSS